MGLAPARLMLDWDGLAKHKAHKTWPHGYGPDLLRFYSPDDDVHGVLVDVLSSAQHSIVLNVYGYDDDELNQILHTKAHDPTVYMQWSLDKSQAGGAHERVLLDGWQNQIGTSIAVGHSSRGAISHLKVVIVDGLYLVSGSTNWSASGETKQDNELALHRNAIHCAQARSILDRNHDDMLKQMAQARAKAA